MHRAGLALLDIERSGGTHPISVTAHGNLVCVLDDGGAGSISGFLALGGNPRPLPGSSRPLSAAAPAPAQIEFTGRPAAEHRQRLGQRLGDRARRRPDAARPRRARVSRARARRRSAPRRERQPLPLRPQPGSHTIAGFRVGQDGSLRPVGSVGGLPAAAVGLAAD